MVRVQLVVLSFCLSLLVPDLSAASVCSPAPQTGCSQSGDVDLVVSRHAKHSFRDWLSWSWQSGEETSSSDFGDPRADTDYALCVYDGAATDQTELEAPAPGTDSLLMDLGAPAGRRWFATPHGGYTFFRPFGSSSGVRFVYLNPGAEGESNAFVVGAGSALGLAALDGVDGDQVISQVQGDNGQCLGAKVGVTYSNGPLFPVSTDVLDASVAEPALDELASLYNRNFGDQGSLNMTLWISAVAATDIQNLVANSDPADLDTTEIFSALHVAGWYGGMWFARDGFQSPAPPGPNPARLATAEFLYAQGRTAALDFSDAEVFDFLSNEVPTAGADQGTGLRSIVSLYGYNTGYSLTVIEDTAGGVIVPPPPSKLACAGTHPPLMAPPFVPGDGPLFGCTYDPSFFDTLDDLRPLRDDYVAAFPVKAEQLRLYQGTEEVRGRQVWTFFLGGVIKRDQAVREALWDVDNAFLEVVHGAGLLNMGAQAYADADLGRQAALASSSVLKGWLSSYQYGLGAPEPRVLPTFDLGTTPIQAP